MAETMSLKARFELAEEAYVEAVRWERKSPFFFGHDIQCKVAAKEFDLLPEALDAYLSALYGK